MAGIGRVTTGEIGKAAGRGRGQRVQELRGTSEAAHRAAELRATREPGMTVRRHQAPLGQEDLVAALVLCGNRYLGRPRLGHRHGRLPIGRETAGDPAASASAAIPCSGPWPGFFEYRDMLPQLRGW